MKELKNEELALFPYLHNKKNRVDFEVKVFNTL